MSRVLLLIFSVMIVMIFVTEIESAKILAIFPAPSISHQVVFRPFTLELAKRGHEVFVITTDPMFGKDNAPANYTEIDVHDISYEYWTEHVSATVSESNDLAVQLEIALKNTLEIFKRQVLSVQVQNVLKDKRKFDLLIVEACVRTSLAFTHIIKAPTIQFSSFGALPGMYESVGAPTHTFLYPLSIRQKILNLTVWEKISEYYNNYRVQKMYLGLEDSEHEELKSIFGSDLPSIAELRKNIDMVFLNIYSLWDFNRPTPPNVVYLGSLHQNPPKDLPKELKNYLDSSTMGVIYMSLGTNVVPSALPPERVQVFLKVFSTLPYNILWKWDKDELEGKPDNVKISKWFPQSDLLRHPNVKLFITQGGLQSTDEALIAGVPLLGVPILWDQSFNTELYLHYKIGLKVDLDTVTEEQLKKAIYTIINDESYRTNVVKLRTLMQDQPQTSLERAIWWTEYVLRHGGARHLRSPAANISWAEYLELELVSVVLIAIIIVLALLTIILRLALKMLSKLISNVKVKTN